MSKKEQYWLTGLMIFNMAMWAFNGYLFGYQRGHSKGFDDGADAQYERIYKAVSEWIKNRRDSQ